MFCFHDINTINIGSYKVPQKMRSEIFFLSRTPLNQNLFVFYLSVFNQGGSYSLVENDACYLVHLNKKLYLNYDSDMKYEAYNTIFTECRIKANWKISVLN